MNLYIDVNPSKLCLLATQRTLSDINDAIANDPNQWWFAVQNLRLSCYCALVVLTRGTAGFGHLEKKSQKEQIEILELERERDLADKGSNLTLVNLRLRELSRKAVRVETFPGLLRRATAKNSDGKSLLNLSEKDIDLLSKLTSVRNGLDHVQDVSWSYPVANFPYLIFSACNLLEACFETGVFIVELEHEEVEQLKSIVFEIRKFGLEIQKQT